GYPLLWLPPFFARREPPSLRREKAVSLFPAAASPPERYQALWRLLRLLYGHGSMRQTGVTASRAIGDVYPGRKRGTRSRAQTFQACQETTGELDTSLLPGRPRQGRLIREANQRIGMNGGAGQAAG